VRLNRAGQARLPGRIRPGLCQERDLRNKGPRHDDTLPRNAAWTSHVEPPAQREFTLRRANESIAVCCWRFWALRSLCIEVFGRIAVMWATAPVPRTPIRVPGLSLETMVGGDASHTDHCIGR
jgi:hypothetical protein